MTLPNFLVIGASRSGTTSLHHYLGQHPSVHMSPVKSPNFFVAGDPQPPWEGAAQRAMARQWITDRGDYEALFRGAGGKRAIGEVSPVYLQSLGAPARIHSACPDAKLVAILREPVDRAWAHYLGRRRDGLERRTDFRAVVEDELARPLPDAVAFGSYVGCSRYHHFLAGYFQSFARERIRIYLFEDLVSDVSALLRDLFEFLEVDPGTAVDTERRHNQTGIVRQPLLRFLWTRTVRARIALRPFLPAAIRDTGRLAMGRELRRPALDPELRATIARVLAPDVERLQHLLGRDLTGWRCAR
ncbi:MAG TPA: sulfotransferase [Thermoanaerobaculia bacterium]|nr:sulfotransferase [Thermoanaerobaculia bacterium]